MIFNTKTQLKNFKTSFTPPKTYSFTRSVLKSIKVKAAEIIANILKWVTDSDDTATTKLSTNLQLIS